MTRHCGIRTALALAVLAGSAAAGGPDSRAGLRAQVPAANIPQFEKDVLPVLTANCLKCHGAGKPKARQIVARSKACRIARVVNFTAKCSELCAVRVVFISGLLKAV